MSQVLHHQITTFAGERRYRQAIIERWLQLDDIDAAAIMALAGELRLGENQLRDLWEWADEIARRDRLSLAEVFGSTDIVAALRRKVGRQDQLKLVKAALRRRRFPNLSTTEDQLAQLVRALKLPNNISIELPEFLEGDGVQVHLRAANPVALRQAAAALLTAAESPTCTELFHLLDEAP
jgi:hypothetical protein